MKTILYPLLALAPTLALVAPLRSGRPTAGPPGKAHPGAEDRGPMHAKQKITTFLWFDDDAEEAVRFYVSLFPGSKVLDELRLGADGPSPEGKLLTARFQLAGQQFIALNGGPKYRFTEAISLAVDCQTQEEVDELWEKLSAGGEPGRCGWLKDRYAPGRSSPAAWARCSRTRIRPRRAVSGKPSCRWTSSTSGA